jgi:hypothetical protein
LLRLIEANPRTTDGRLLPRKRLIPHQHGAESLRRLSLIENSGDIDIMKAPALI